MRYLGWSTLLSAWLIVSAFALPQSAGSTALTVLAAFVTLSVAAFAVARPAIRYANAFIALGLAGAALFGAPGAAAIANALAAAGLFALSLVSPVHARAPAEPELAGRT
jgi:hypothetical protein